MVSHLKVLLSKGGLLLSVKPKKTFFQGFKKLVPPKPVDIGEYSIKRLMLFGLILPAIVVLNLLLSIYVSLTLKLPLNIACILVFSWTFMGFIFGTLILIRCTDWILKHAKVKEKC